MVIGTPCNGPTAAPRTRRVRLLRFRASFGKPWNHHGVEPRIDRLDAANVCFDQLAARDVAMSHLPRHLAGGKGNQIRGRRALVVMLEQEGRTWWVLWNLSLAPAGHRASARRATAGRTTSLR